MANRITTLFDLDSKGFDGGLKKLRSEVANADGAVNKLKAAGSGLGAILKDNLGAAALGAGTALVGFGIKAVTAFQNTALAAGKFADATGLAVEDASRWIEVAGDIGVSSDEVESALGKMNKTLGKSPALFSELGVEVAKTKDGSTDANQTFLNVIDRLNGITDPAEKARVATQLLGKGWQGMAELIAQGSGNLKASLAGVQDGKVINAAELEKARDLRAKLDNLSDSIENVALKIGGELAPAVADAVSGISGAVGVMTDLNEQATKLTGSSLVDWAQTLASPIGVATKGLDKLGKALGDDKNFSDELSYAWDWLTGNSDDLRSSVDDTADAQQHAKEITQAQAGMTAHLADVTDDATQATDDLKAAYDTLTGSWKDQSDWLNVLDALDQFKWKMAEGKMSTREQAQATLDLKQKLGEYVDKTADIPTNIKTSLLADIDRGSWDYVQSYIDQVVRGRTVNIGGIVVGAPGRQEEQTVNGKRAAGGPVSAGSTYLVCEQGSELLTMGSSS